MSKLQITIYKNTKKPEAVKAGSLYVSTHEKLTAFQKECGLSLPRLIDLCVNFTLERAVIVEEAPDYKVEEE